MFNPSKKAVTTALAIVCSLALPALADVQDKLAMNTGAPTTSYQDNEVKQAIETLNAVERKASSKDQPKKQQLRQHRNTAGNILILGGAEAFPM